MKNRALLIFSFLILLAYLAEGRSHGRDSYKKFRGHGHGHHRHSGGSRKEKNSNNKPKEKLTFLQRVGKAFGLGGDDDDSVSDLGEKKNAYDSEISDMKGYKRNDDDEEELDSDYYNQASYSEKRSNRKNRHGSKNKKSKRHLKKYNDKDNFDEDEYDREINEMEKEDYVENKKNKKSHGKGKHDSSHKNKHKRPKRSKEEKHFRNNDEDDNLNPIDESFEKQIPNQVKMDDNIEQDYGYNDDFMNVEKSQEMLDSDISLNNVENSINEADNFDESEELEDLLKGGAYVETESEKVADADDDQMTTPEDENADQLSNENLAADEVTTTDKDNIDETTDNFDSNEASDANIMAQGQEKYVENSNDGYGEVGDNIADDDYLFEVKDKIISEFQQKHNLQEAENGDLFVPPQSKEERLMMSPKYYFDMYKDHQIEQGQIIPGEYD